MANHRLDNYLRTYRKRFGFSQDEIALLLGSRSGAKVSRYERNGREPKLRTALACARFFRIPTEELFAGMVQKVDRSLVKGALELSRRLESAKPGPLLSRKLQLLSAITDPNREVPLERP